MFCVHLCVLDALIFVSWEDNERNVPKIPAVLWRLDFISFHFISVNDMSTVAALLGRRDKQELVTA